jgi:DNA uptake protein ComE-like DNA-binding protein
MRHAKLSVILLMAAAICGCTQEQDPAKTRREAAEAAARLKEESKQAAVELRKDAKEAGRQGKAIAEGAKEGWNEGSQKININTASKAQLETLPGIDGRTAQRMIDGRPYRNNDELTHKRIISPEEYQKIAGRVVTQ